MPPTEDLVALCNPRECPNWRCANWCVATRVTVCRGAAHPRTKTRSLCRISASFHPGVLLSSSPGDACYVSHPPVHPPRCACFEVFPSWVKFYKTRTGLGAADSVGIYEGVCSDNTGLSACDCPNVPLTR
jgi:hypothetical protein